MDNPQAPKVDSTSNVEGIAGALPAVKTPVSVLQELCMRRGNSPKYELVQIEGEVHDPIFVYRVTIGNFTTDATGSSKKKAKHAAAKTVLDIIMQAGGAGLPGVGDPPEVPSQFLPPNDDDIPGNPVGSLLELCVEGTRWPAPTYDLTKEEGAPHDRTFSIACIVGANREIGSGKSKKLAKRQAAHKMITHLKDMPSDSEQQSINDDTELKTVDKFSQLNLQGINDENSSSIENNLKKENI